MAALERRTHLLLDAAWHAGIRYVDAARSYGYAEAFLGSWLAAHPDRRAALTIGSKWGYEYVGEWRMDAPLHERKEHSCAMFDRQWPQTLSALGTTPEVYLIHSVTPHSPALADAALLDRLRRLAESGVCVGFSTSGPAQGAVLDRARRIPDSPFRAVQATWNLWEQSAASALERAHDAGWLVVVKEALANGRLAQAGPDTPIGQLARRDGQAAGAFALGAALAQPWADVVLSGAVTAAQVHANLGASAPSVDPEELRAQAVEPDAYWAKRSARAWA